MAIFYKTMLGIKTARKLYIQAILIFLLLFHYVFVSGHFGDYGVLLSTIPTLAFFSNRIADRLLHLLHKDRKGFVTMAMLVLAIMTVSHLYTMAVTLDFILLAAAFYPSESALEGWQDEKTRKHWYNRPEELTKAYYSNITRDCHDNVDSGNSEQSTQCTINNSKQE
ncbi:MAG: hypothetical protein IKC18_07030 [Bacteroidaceae bacterium]|nr:hypothetical protein [Bacteroidaceae bacterium]